MGWFLSWVAVRGASADEVRRRLGLRPTGRTSSRPDRALSCTTSDHGWVVVCANADDRLVDGALAGPLSARSEVVGCLVDEDERLSQAVAWEDGAPRWSVTHDADTARDHLRSSGELPPAFQALEAAAAEARRRDPEGADLLFDVPLDLARAVVGFRHDGREDRVFEELEPVQVLAHPADPAGAGLLGTVSRWLHRT